MGSLGGFESHPTMNEGICNSNMWVGGKSTSLVVMRLCSKSQIFCK